MNKKLLLSFLSFTLISTMSNAQKYLGVATGSDCRALSMYLNPANIVDTQQRFTLNLISINVRVDNNLGTFPSIGNLSKAFNNNSNDTGSSGSSGSSGIFTNSGRKNFSMIVPEVNIHGPGLIVGINKKNSIAITTGIRVINQFNNFDQQLYNTITNTGSVTNANYAYSAQKFNWTAHAWNEIGFTYAGVFIDKPAEQLRVGVTIKRLGGIGYLALKGNNLDLKYYSGADSFHAANSDIEFASNVVNDSSAVFSGVNSGNIVDRFFGANAGVGLGADVGIVYSHKFGNLDPKDYMESDVTHNLVLSAAVTDLGSIKYKENTNSIINVSGNGYLTGAGLSGNVITDPASLKSYLRQQGFTADTSSAATKLHMPTTLIISGDYELRKRIYINATFIGNLANRQLFGNSYYSQLTVTPRFDTRVFSIGLPITYSWLAGDIKAGLGIRVSGFFIGTDDMLAIFSDHQYGFGVYMGGYIPIKYKKKLRLEDHDHYERWVQ